MKEQEIRENLLGMPEDEVRAILGDPSTSFNSELLGSTWVYPGGRMIEFDKDGRVKSYYGF